MGEKLIQGAALEPIGGDVRAAIEAVERLHTPTPIGAGTTAEGELVAVPRGMLVVDLKPHLDARRTRPERMKGIARLTTLAAFIAFVRRFADENSAIFAIDNRKAPKLVAVFDYHEANQRDEDDAVTVVGEPRFGDHRAEYAFPLSDPWKAWNEIAGRALTQAEFAAFLEERIADVLAPEHLGDRTLDVAQSLRIQLAGADELMALSRGLSVRVDAKVTQAVNLSTGESAIAFEETHRDKDGGGPLRVPGGFALGMPVFRGGVSYAIVARLRYRVSGGSIAWTISLQRVDESFDNAFTEACNDARAGTGLPLFYGQPEA